jgi:hypothetical protein
MCAKSRTSLRRETACTGFSEEVQVKRLERVQRIQWRNPINAVAPSERRSKSSEWFRAIRLCCAVLLLLMTTTSTTSRAWTPGQSKPAGSAPSPEAAVPAILAALDKYEVVGMPVDHGEKDLDDFILLLIRNPAFLEKVNDIAVECGNSLYQPVLDRYIAGEDVPFREVQKVWRNTTQPACGLSGFYEQLFPLVRVINQKLPTGKRLRVLAGDSPIDWDQIKTPQQRGNAMKNAHRDASIAAVMEKEVLLKHRRALMLFGLFHILHGVGASAVSIYEKEYPSVTFIISDLGTFGTDLPSLSSGPLASWPIPSLAPIKSTWMGALDLAHFFPPPTLIDKECNVHTEFPRELQKPMEDLVDAFLYLGPQDLRLREKMPADIALDPDYKAGGPAMEGGDQQEVQSAKNPIFVIDTKPPDQTAIKGAVQSCLDEQNRHSSPP